jgi:anti-sigma factor ChrR (cupin superfamily)
LKVPANYKIPAHNHLTAEYVTVISGKFHIGMGDKLDEKKGVELRAGGFGAAPAHMNHYAWASEDTVVQVHGQGPFAISPGASRIFVRVGFWKLPPVRGLLPAPWPLTRPRLW